MGNTALKMSPRPLAGRSPAFFRKRLQALGLTAAALLLAAAAGAWLLQLRAGDHAVRIAATVNGVPIAQEELAQAMAAQKAKTAAYFKAKYDADAGPGFWTKSFGGEVPGEKLKREALAQTVQLKLQQAMAKQEGLTDDISYEAFLKRLKAENKRRANAGDDQTGVYGPEQYNETTYYSLLNSDLIGELKNKLEGRMTWKDDQLRAYYKAHAAKQFTDRAAIRAETVSVSFAPGSSLTESEAEAAVRDIAEKMNEGMSAADAAKSYKGQAAVETVMLDGETARAASLQKPQLVSNVQELRTGQHTGVFQENGAFVYAVVTNRAEGRTHSFDEVKDGIASQLSDEAYDALVARAIKSAKVGIRHDVYDRLDVESL